MKKNHADHKNEISDYKTQEMWRYGTLQISDFKQADYNLGNEMSTTHAVRRRGRQSAVAREGSGMHRRSTCLLVMISFVWRERDVHSIAARDGVAVDGVAADGVAGRDTVYISHAKAYTL